MNAVMYSSTGTKSATAAKLKDDVFKVETSNHKLLQTAYHAYLANSRQNLAVTKTRGLVSGGGKKPWKQKGTGRARFGSSRVPIWRGGGIVFGPTGQENYTISLNLKARRLAIKQAISLKAADKKVVVLDSLDLKKGKTSEASKLIDKLGGNSLNVLIISVTPTKEQLLATANIPNVKLVNYTRLNVFDTLNAGLIVITTDAVKEIEKWLGDK